MFLVTMLLLFLEVFQEWADGFPSRNWMVYKKKNNVIDSEDVDIVSYDDSQKQLNLDF